MAAMFSFQNSIISSVCESVESSIFTFCSTKNVRQSHTEFLQKRQTKIFKINDYEDVIYRTTQTTMTYWSLGGDSNTYFNKLENAYSLFLNL